MAPKIKFSKFSNLPCLLAEVMVKDFFSLYSCDFSAQFQYRIWKPAGRLFLGYVSLSRPFSLENY